MSAINVEKSLLALLKGQREEGLRVISPSLTKRILWMLPGILVYVSVTVLVTLCVWTLLSPPPFLVPLILLCFAVALLGPFTRIVDTATRGIIRIFNKRTRRLAWEGICFLVPFAEDLLIFDCKRTTDTIVIDKVFTPDDQAEIKVTAEITTQPSDDPGEFVVYAEVEDPLEQLRGMFAEAVRGFAADAGSPPKKWDEAIRMHEKFARMIVAKLSGQEIPRNENGDHLKWGEMSEEQQKEKVKTQLAWSELDCGQGDFHVSGIGLVIRRLNITRIDPSDALAEALKLIATEDQQRKAQVIEAGTVSRRIITYLKDIGVPEEAIANPQKLIEYLKLLGLSLDKLGADFRAETKKGTEHIITLRASSEIADVRAALLAALGSLGKGGAS